MNKLKIFLEMIKFEHTVFALPFAYLGYLLGARGQIIWPEVFWITLVMVTARTAGMCLNRLLDREIDAKNPRSKNWALVTGAFSVKAAWVIAAVCLAAMTWATLHLKPICVKLLPAAFLALAGYHFMKRFTLLCHLGIGGVLAFAPMGGWLAATGTLETGAVLLGAAVLFWAAGFDIFYSMQDASFDREMGLHSMPARWGESPARVAAAFFHILTLCFLIALGIMQSLHLMYWFGLTAGAVILAAQHGMIAKDRAKYLNAAFFTMNGTLSAGFLVTTALGLYW